MGGNPNFVELIIIINIYIVIVFDLVDKLLKKITSPSPKFIVRKIRNNNNNNMIYKD